MHGVEQIDSGKMGNWSARMSREGQVMVALMRENGKWEQVRREGHVTATGELGTNAGASGGLTGFPVYKECPEEAMSWFWFWALVSGCTLQHT